MIRGRAVLDDLSHHDVLRGGRRDLDHDVREARPQMDPSDAVVLADESGRVGVEDEVGEGLPVGDVVVDEIVVVRDRQGDGHLRGGVAEQPDADGTDGPSAVEDSEGFLGILTLCIPAFCAHDASPP